MQSFIEENCYEFKRTRRLGTTEMGTEQSCKHQTSRDWRFECVVSSSSHSFVIKGHDFSILHYRC